MIKKHLCRNAGFRQRGRLVQEIKLSVSVYVSNYSPKQSRLCKQKRAVNLFASVGRKYNGRITSQCNWLPYSWSFHSADRQIQLIHHSLHKNSVKFKIYKIPQKNRFNKCSDLELSWSIHVTCAWEHRLFLLVTPSKSRYFLVERSFPKRTVTFRVQ